MSSPTLLIVGTTYGAANTKEVVAHIRGLASRMATSPERVFYGLRKWTDLHGKTCHLYELQEGGNISVLDSVVELLEQGQTITFELAGNHYAEITHDNGAVLTVVHESKHHQPDEVFDIPTTGRRLKSIEGEATEIKAAGLVVFSLGLATLLGTIAFALLAGTMSPVYPAQLPPQVTPAQALKRAQSELERNQYIHQMRYNRSTREFLIETRSVGRSAVEAAAQETSQPVDRPEPGRHQGTIWN